MLDLMNCKAAALLQTFSTEDLAKLFPESYIELATNMLWQSYLFENALYERKLLQEMGIEGVDSWFPCAIEFLFRNNAAVELVFNEQRAALLQDGRFNIGIQIRFDPTHKRMLLSDIRYFAECAQRIEMEAGKSAEESRWVLVTDTPDQILPIMRELVGSQRDLFWFNGTVEGETVNQKNIIDHQLLSV